MLIGEEETEDKIEKHKLKMSLRPTTGTGEPLTQHLISFNPWAKYKKVGLVAPSL